MMSLNSCTLDQVLEHLDSLAIPYRLVGPRRPINKVCSLLQKEPNGLYYYSGNEETIFHELKHSIVICRENVAQETDSCSSIVVKTDPQVVFYKLCKVLFKDQRGRSTHATAIVHPEALIGDEVYIGPYSVIGRCKIGSRTTIEAHCVIFDGCEIGEAVRIDPHSCIGASGAIWVWGDNEERIVLPQVGGVRIEDDVFLASDVTIVRGLFNEWTTIGQGTLIAPGSKIGHSVVLEEYCHLANNVSIAGSARIGARSFLGSGCSIRSHVKISPDTIVGSGSAVVKNVDRPGVTVAGVPAKELEHKSQRIGVPAAKGDRSLD